MPPKKNKKSNQDEVADDFDDMLADFRAADLANASPSDITENAVDATPENAARAQPSEIKVPETTILAAIKAGALTKLRRWHRQGLRFSAYVVCQAAGMGSIAVMTCLVDELGADFDRADDDGYTPIFIALQFGNLGSVRYLARMLGADVNKTSAKGASPLFVAAQNGHLEVVRCLLKASGADVNQARDDGITPMMIAADSGHVAVVQYLGREHGADVNLAARDGFTALIIAAQNGHLDVVKCLVEELGADINLADHDGRTALMMASYCKHEKVIRWLMKHGADIQATATYGTAIDASIEGGAPIAQTEYLEAKAHCSNPGCSGAGLKKCTGCKQARYCGQACQLSHWKAHKADCKATKKA
jgi:ankyrin repeat protein